MNTTKRILLAAAVALSFAASVVAEEPVRCIVTLKHRAAAAPNVASLGGTIESRQDEQLVVLVPTDAVAKLRTDPAVLYLQRVSESSLIGGPAEPEPGVVAMNHLRPRPLGSTPKDLGIFSYDGAGNIIAIGSDTYSYDGTQRLKQSSTAGIIETYTYDGFGNMKTRVTNGVSQTIAVDDTTNRLNGSGYLYDGAGHMLTGESYGLTYEAVGQPLSKTYPGEDTEYYVYTASDERIAVRRGGWWHWSLRDEGGKVLRQYRSSATNPTAPSLWIEDFVWRDGLLLGSNRPVEMGGRRHFHLDHLGTPRLITSDNGQLVSAHDYYPFGDEKTSVVQEGPGSGGFDREGPLKFTGHERDFAGGFGAEDGHSLDYMHARYYSSLTGRFLRPDPLLGDPRQPQTLNRYSYVFNNPINYSDPFGLAAKQPWTASLVADCEPGQQLPPGGCHSEVTPGGGAGGNGAALPGMVRLSDRQFIADYNEWRLKSAQMQQSMARLRARARRGDEWAMMLLGYPGQAFGIRPTYDEFLVVAPLTGLLKAGAFAGASSAGWRAVVGEGAEITFGHGARHLAGSGLERAAVETAIRTQIQADVMGASATGTFWGRLPIGGVTIEYRAHTLSTGTINVGTYFPVFP